MLKLPTPYAPIYCVFKFIFVLNGNTHLSLFYDIFFIYLMYYYAVIVVYYVSWSVIELTRVFNYKKL